MTTETSSTTSEQSTHVDLSTASGVKLTFTAKGYCQPEITLRYPTPDLALQYATRDAMSLFDDLRTKARVRGIMLVSDQIDQEAR